MTDHIGASLLKILNKCDEDQFRDWQTEITERYMLSFFFLTMDYILSVILSMTLFLSWKAYLEARVLLWKADQLMQEILEEQTISLLG